MSVKTSGKSTISIAVIAKNEEDRIADLLNSCSFADEIVVVDSGSTDRTLEICESFGVKIFHQTWLGYAAQKQYALDNTTSEWVLSLDADEVIPEQTHLEIFEVLKATDQEVKGFSLPRLSWYLGRWIRHGGWFPDRKVRMVRRGYGQWVGDTLHEKLEVRGPVKQLKNPIWHFVYRNISDQIATIDSFSTTFAAAKKSRFPSMYLLFGIWHSLFKFFECAIWKLGILDGLPGLVIAVNSSFYVFLKHAKVWEASFTSGRQRTGS
ncbi:MAG: glycosyltransferase family 2 protein [Desulfomonilaceae bacterium]